jgi:uncharacterized protein YndB with AHSA1/START domain
MADIRHQINIKADQQKTYVALTTAPGIRAWWTDNADLDQQIGGAGVFRFHYDKTVETVVLIADLQPSVLVCWAVTSSFRPEQDGTVIRFELSPEAGGTLIDFSHTGFAEAGETFNLMNKGWAYYLVSLKRYLETGKGAPSPHIDFSIMETQN